jgi:hypothetical protein
MPRLLAGLLLLCLPDPAHAGPATERYAPLQLQMARQALEQAHALRSADADLAARLARQAVLDAHLAHRMSESPALQREAAGVADESARLARKLEARQGS